MSYVYKVTFNKTGQFYIGAKKCKEPSKENLFKKYFTSSKPVKLLIEEFGLESFSYEILFESVSYEECYEIEQKLIYENFNNPDILNRSCYFKRKGFGILSDEAKNKISKNTKKMWKNPIKRAEIIEKHKVYANSEQGKIRNSSASIIRWSNPDQRKKQSELAIEINNNPNKKEKWNNIIKQKNQKNINKKYRVHYKVNLNQLNIN